MEVEILATGILVVDIIAAGLPKVASPGEVVFTPRGIKTRIGGHPANVSIDLVKLGLEGDRIGVVGSVGDDIYGRFVEETLRKHGIRTFLKRSSGAETSKNLILVVKGQDRRFHVDVGANILLEPAYLRELVEDFEPRILYVGATGWLGKVDEELDTILKEAKERGALTFVDVIAPYGKEWSYIAPSLKYADIFHSNDIEAAGITGLASAEESAERLVEMGVGLALITMGERGLLARTERWSIEMGAYSVDVVDPTGAGDAFCAGIMRRLAVGKTALHDLSVSEALDLLAYASAVGASAATKEGTTDGVSASLIERLMAEQGSRLKGSAKVRIF